MTGELKGWQPIETAPLGNLLLYAPAKVARNRGMTHQPRLYIGVRSDAPNRPPTHWMPLPSPPKGDSHDQ
jgi:hypothetical protein